MALLVFNNVKGKCKHFSIKTMLVSPIMFKAFSIFAMFQIAQGCVWHTPENSSHQRQRLCRKRYKLGDYNSIKIGSVQMGGKIPNSLSSIDRNNKGKSYFL